MPSRPSPTRSLLRGAARRCPRCGAGKLFRRWFSMTPSCPRCGLAFEPREGAFLGSMSLNYGVAVILGFGVMIAGLVAGLELVPLMAVCFAAVALGLVLFFPFSKTIWAAFELMMRDPDDVERDHRAG